MVWQQSQQRGRVYISVIAHQQQPLGGVHANSSDGHQCQKEKSGHQLEVYLHLPYFPLKKEVSGVTATDRGAGVLGMWSPWWFILVLA